MGVFVAVLALVLIDGAISELAVAIVRVEPLQASELLCGGPLFLGMAEVWAGGLRLEVPDLKGQESETWSIEWRCLH